MTSRESLNHVDLSEFSYQNPREIAASRMMTPDVVHQQEKEDLFAIQKETYLDGDKYKNMHDVIDRKGLIHLQHEQLEKIKIDFRRANELYIRQHPELNVLISVFMCKLLEDQPSNVLAYAGTFFDKYSLSLGS